MWQHIKATLYSAQHSIYWEKNDSPYSILKDGLRRFMLLHGFAVMLLLTVLLSCMVI